MPKFSCNISMLFSEAAFLDRFALAAAAGFHAVEFHEPYGYPKAEIAAALAEHRLELALFNLPMGSAERGEAGIACLPDRKQEFRDGVGQAIDYAQALGCRQLNCLAGIAPSGVARAGFLDVFIENLAYAADQLASARIRLLVEPLNSRDVPGFLLARSSDAIAAIDATGASNIFLQHDFYHAQIMEGDLAPTFERLLLRIGHVQFSDNPGRHEPGTGEINFPFLFDRLDQLGYAGWVGAEYRPSGRTEASLGWFARYRDR